MQIIRGTATLEQIAAGRLQIFHRQRPEGTEQSGLRREQEWERFLHARRRGVQELEQLRERILRRAGEETAVIFTVHSMIMEDEELTQSVRHLIWEQGVSAEWAVWKTAESVTASFRAMDDPYMRARGADIQDIARRFIRILTGGRPQPVLEAPVILAADYFLPSEVMGQGRNLLGIVSRNGSLDSHTAMLLRACRIPAIIGAPVDDSWDGRQVLLDGFAGVLYLEPDRQVLEELRSRYQAGGRGPF